MKFSFPVIMIMVNVHVFRPTYAFAKTVNKSFLTCIETSSATLTVLFILVNCVDIEQEPLSTKINNRETLEIEDTLNNRISNKTSLEVISPKKNQGWLESNVDNVPSSDNVTPKLKNIYTEQNRDVFGKQPCPFGLVFYSYIMCT